MVSSLRLIPPTHGNRPPDPFGNWHTATDRRGLTVLRRPPSSYVGRHRR
jgi:hypothetical protein